MMETIRSAWNGWLALSKDGKLIGLFLIAMLLMWVYYEAQERAKQILVYSSAMAFLCILPISAAVFMFYQTKFYDYEWIWSYVPVTIVIALGLSYFVSVIIPACVKTDVKKGLGAITLLIITLVLCGNIAPKMPGAGEKKERKQIQKVLKEVRHDAKESDLFIWAPQDILEHARSVDSSVILLYGRNMWDKSLNAYTFDTYSEDVEEMYQWMEAVDDKPASRVKIRHYLRVAKENGVNCLIVSKNKPETEIDILNDQIGSKPMEIGDYYYWNL